jgi:DNA-binding HxlR family transcriptional regulator
MSKSATNDGAANKSVETHPLVKMANEMKDAIFAAYFKPVDTKDTQSYKYKSGDIDMIRFVGITEMATILRNDLTDKARDMENILNEVRSKGRLVMTSHDLREGLPELEAARLVHVERRGYHLSENQVSLTEDGKEVIDLLAKFGFSRADLIKLRETDRYANIQDTDLPIIRGRGDF